MRYKEFLDTTYNELMESGKFPEKVTRVVHELCEHNTYGEEIFITRFFNDVAWNNQPRSYIIDNCFKRAKSYFLDFDIQGWKVKYEIYSEFIKISGEPLLLQCIQNSNEIEIKIYPLNTSLNLTSITISSVLNEILIPPTTC